MTSAQVVETSVIVNNNSSFENYTNPDDHTQQTIDDTNTDIGVVLQQHRHYFKHVEISSNFRFY